MPGDSGVLVVTRVPSTTTTCTRNRGCSGHPAFPTPSKGGETFHQRLGRIAPRDHEVCRQPVDPIRYTLVGSRGSRIRAIVICPALEMRPLNLPAAACNKSPDAFSVIASALCTSEGTPVDQQFDACNEIIALKVFSGEKLATIYFWRAVGWTKKGNYAQVISDASEAIRLKPDV